MILPKMNLKSVLAGSMLLALAGCGCNDDSSLTTLPQANPAVLGARTSAPPLPVDPIEQELEPVRIDIAFLLDDSDSMNQALLGIIPDNQGIDQRVRTDAAQAIMEQLEATIIDRLQQEWLDSGLTPEEFPEIDLAFAVARFEDFGGEFTSPLRRNALGNDNDLFGYGNPRNDMDARPFILNMPILRQNHPQFADRFAQALSREAPGDGNPYFQFPGQDTVIAVSDAQSAIEALYQCAAPANNDGTFGGFDANGNNSTLDSGAPTSLDASRNPQTRPGDSGDVPAIGFMDTGVADPDGQAQYAILDENGAKVMIPNPAGGGEIESIGSGNIGGLGWRDCSARFIILASDVATVAPTATPPQGADDPLSDLNPPADTEMVSSSDGASTPTSDPRPAPRGARSVLLGAFDSGIQLVGGSGVIERRIGVADGPTQDGGNGVAPVGAHTVQETIDALNELDIEVLCIGTPFRGGLDTKPGDTGVNGDTDSDIGSDDFDPSNPAVVQPDMAPWFYFTAVNRLTAPEITSVPLGGGEDLFPAVYNIATVWPLQLADTTGATKTGIKNTVTDDLIERIRDWVETPYIESPTLKGEQVVGERLEVLPNMTWRLTLEIFPPEESDIVQAAPLVGGLPQTIFTTDISVPLYYSDETAPAATEFSAPAISFVARDESVPLPANMLLPFTITAQFVEFDFSAMTPEQQAQFETEFRTAVENFIKERGNGDVELSDLFETIKQGEGVALITVRPPNDTGPTVQLVTYAEGSFIINDLSPGADGSDQVGGSGEAFPPNPTDAD